MFEFSFSDDAGIDVHVATDDAFGLGVRKPFKDFADAEDPDVVALFGAAAELDGEGLGGLGGDVGIESCEKGGEVFGVDDFLPGFGAIGDFVGLVTEEGFKAGAKELAVGGEVPVPVTGEDFVEEEDEDFLLIFDELLFLFVVGDVGDESVPEGGTVRFALGAGEAAEPAGAFGW